MSEPERKLVASLMGCVFFGYAVVNCLVFYTRTRSEAGEYRGRVLSGFVRSPQYGWTIWITGAIGAIGFVVASWQFILSVVAIAHGG